MTPLVTIYAGPKGLLDKVRRDEGVLLNALVMYGEEEMRDALFNFSVSAYHVIDWITGHHLSLEKEVRALLGNERALRVCRDLCNASKHDKYPYKKHPNVLEDVTQSATVTADGNQGWRLKLILNDGSVWLAEDWAARVVEIWEAFFAKHHIS